MTPTRITPPYLPDKTLRDEPDYRKGLLHGIDPAKLTLELGVDDSEARRGYRCYLAGCQDKARKVVRQ